MSTLVIQSFLARFQTLADGGLRLIFDCGEQKPETFKSIGALNKRMGVLVFKGEVEELSEEEMEEIKSFDVKSLTDIKKKSKSQKLRGVLYQYYLQEKKKEQDGASDEVKGFETFDSFYDYTMHQIIDFYWKQIENLY